MSQKETREVLTDAVMDTVKTSFEKFFKESPFAGQFKDTYTQDDVYTAMLGAYLGGGTEAFRIIKILDSENAKNPAKES